MEESDLYKGREHSGIKHYLLRSYLELLFMIIGQHEKRICYIDCFSGPWREADQNLAGTSIALSLNVMHKCRTTLQSMGKPVEFRALFVEKGKRSYKKLDCYLKDTWLEGITAESMNGDFYDLRSDILRWCGTSDFAFFFIDPKGWKNAIEIPTLTPLLQGPRPEYLINFMYDFLNRTVPQESFQDDMKTIFGEVPDISGMEPKGRENHLINLYRNCLKSVPASSKERLRTAYVSIMDSVKERTKYHLVYLTRHPFGIIKFMGASEKMEIAQKRVRMRTKQQHRTESTRTEDLFADRVDAVATDTIDMDDVKQYWLDQLTHVSRQFGIDELADMLEETNWFETNLQQAFNELIDEGKTINLDAPRRRPKKPVHFEKNERLQRIDP
jgi:three-Cys-motif partner protein